MSQKHAIGTRTHNAKKEHRTPPKRRRRSARWTSPTVVGLSVVVLLGGIAALFKFSGTSTAVRETAPVQITGTRLPTEQGAPDAAIGMKAPEVRGVDFDGRAVAITNDGHAKAISLLAHWCPHCQRELPKVANWLTNSGGVEGVDVYAVSTMASATKPNWPPSAWFEAWPAPVLVDDADSSVTQAFGLSGTPLWIFVRPDGTVANRISGEVPLNTLEAQMRALLA